MGQVKRVCTSNYLYFIGNSDNHSQFRNVNANSFLASGCVWVIDRPTWKEFAFFVVDDKENLLVKYVICWESDRFTKYCFNNTLWITAKGFNSAMDSPPHTKMPYCELDTVEESPTRGPFARLDFVNFRF